MSSEIPVLEAIAKVEQGRGYIKIRNPITVKEILSGEKVAVFVEVLE